MFLCTAQITPDLEHVESKKIYKERKVQTMMTRIASSIPI